MKRVERRQAETLIRESEAQEAIETDRRSQQALDNWYSFRQYREGAEAEPLVPVAEGSVSKEPVASGAPAEQKERIVNET